MKLINTDTQRMALAPFETIEQLNANTIAIRDQYAEFMTPTEKAVLDVLHRFASKHFGVSYLSKTSIAEKVGVSRRQVIRICNKFESLGFIVQYATGRRAGGGQTSNTIVFLTQISARDAFVNKSAQVADNMPEVIGVDGADTANVTPNVTGLDALEDAPKEIKNINNTKATKASAMDCLKLGLLEKIPQAIRQAIEPFFTSVDDIYRIVGAIYNGKKAVDKSLRIEDHGAIFYSSVVSVLESWKRAMRKERAFDVFRVMFKAAKDAAESIKDGTAYEEKPLINRIVNKKASAKVVVESPDWFAKEKERLVSITTAPIDMDKVEERKAALRRRMGLDA